MSLDNRSKKYSQLRDESLKNRCRGFTLVELIIVIAILGTLMAIATPLLSHLIQTAKVSRAIAEIHLLEQEITAYVIDNDTLPGSLNDIGRGTLLDPWGNPYQYADINAIPPGHRRKDHSLHPLNSDYDLYSKGKDGKSSPPITAHISHDDIIRANDGEYIGLASEY